MFTDIQMLNWLEAQNAKAKYTGRCVFRWSHKGRGWRLHETSREITSHQSVREAIQDAMEQEHVNPKAGNFAGDYT